ncbi:hypothetical protein [Cognatiluteimonas telluris]|uniref:hypothetical protein n=1 Tax=Cognatiluteimonas telluris TaxID=1104775 RepID=UPI00140B8CBB|nr:hypothetical protein [Lysobacter telluris]
MDKYPRAQRARAIAKESDLTYTQKEANYFYWHCCTAALLLSQIDLNTATRVHVGNAVRMATLNAVGKKGVRASKAAHEEREAAGKEWSKLGLIREHAFPISVLLDKVLEAHKKGDIYTWRELKPYLKDEDFVHWNVLDSDTCLDSRAPLSAVIAALVRRFTVLAWITKSEDMSLKDKGLTKSMPANYGDDLLARYTICKIDLVDLNAPATT